MKKIEKIIESLKAHIDSKTLLEITCGDSEFSINAAKYADKVIATDISLYRIDRISKETIPSNLEFYEMDATRLEFEDNNFDLAVCCNGMGHLGDDALNAVNEMLRVIEPNGKAIILGTWKLEIPIIEKINQHFMSSEKFHVEDIGNKEWNGIVISKW